jgi:hypothetical protein
MKKIIPFHSFTILTPDRADEVVQRLKQCLLYQGSFSEEGFQITRNTYRAAFTQIKGTLEAQPHQTAVHIQMNLHPVFIGLLGFLLFISYGVVIPSVFESASYMYAKPNRTSIYSLPSDGNLTAAIIKSVSESKDGTLPTHLAVFYLGFPIVIVIIFIASFWADAKRIRWELTQIIRGSSDIAGDS